MPGQSRKTTKKSTKKTTAAVVNPTPRPRLVLKHTAPLPSAKAATDENPPSANSNSSKDPDPPLSVAAQEACALLQPVTQTASQPMQAPTLPLATSTSGSTQPADPVPTEAATSTIQSTQLPDSAPARDSNIAEQLAVALGRHSFWSSIMH